ncbi:hypothetical protein EIP86_007104 [Pleurotus ostreatoroseus]|nr:hypothetical protein EIP86_007104 [Pleurotus ostreatoroseus]
MAHTVYAPSEFVYTDPGPSRSTVSIGSPRRKRHTLQATYQFSDAKTKKDAVFRDITTAGYVVSKDVFFNGLLPRLKPGIDVSKTVHKLTDHNIIRQSRFTHFPVDPASASDIENRVFQSLEPLVMSIVATVQNENFQPTMKFMCNPNGVPVSFDRRSNSRPDCYLVEADCDSLEWIGIGASGELKKTNLTASQVDNERKEVWSMSHCMNEDARRRFTFGFTIENTTMRLWYVNRRVLYVSTPFDFLTVSADVHATCHLFLSLMFAKSWELGWDSSMVRREKGQFDITIRDTVWRTVERLSDVNADCLLGRGTRVWKAQQVIDKETLGPPVVLKDFWIEDTREREGDIYRLLHKAGAGKYLLSVVVDGDVFIQPGEFYDCTEHWAVESAQKPEKSAPLNLVYAFRNLQPTTPSPGVYVFPEIPPPSLDECDPRSHYRMVLDAVYTPLHKWTLLSDIVLAVSKACSALHTIHKAGWVHRDITPQNLLVRSENGKGSGLFLAVEADFGMYKFTNISPGKTDNPPDYADDIVDDYADSVNEIEKSTPITPPVAVEDPASFRYNALHDFESLVWALWHFLASREAYEDGTPKGISSEQRVFSWKLFFCEDTRFNRHNFLTNDIYYNQFVSALHPSVRLLAEQLGIVRKELVKTYAKIEQDVTTIDKTAADSIAELLQVRLERVAERLRRRKAPVSLHGTFNKRLEEFAEFFSLCDPSQPTLPHIPQEPSQDEEVTQSAIPTDIVDTTAVSNDTTIVDAPMTAGSGDATTDNTEDHENTSDEADAVPSKRASRKRKSESTTDLPHQKVRKIISRLSMLPRILKRRRRQS